MDPEPFIPHVIPVTVLWCELRWNLAIRLVGRPHMSDPLADSSARLERLLDQVMTETDPVKYDELCAEIWRALYELEEVRKGAETRRPR